jgi:GTPase SAR1 family protein
MSVVIIGDRKTGKTSMIRALAENGRNVRIADGRSLAGELYNPETKDIAGTDEVVEQTLTIEVELPNSMAREIYVNWIDTPGEFWQNKQLSKDFPTQWRDLQQKIVKSSAVILMLPPPDSLVRKTVLDSAPAYLKPPTALPTSSQWSNRLKDWLDFLEKTVDSRSRIKHVLIVMHKADLFCDARGEGDRWKYKANNGGAAPWFEYNSYVIERYFGSAQHMITQYQATEAGMRSKFFITTTENQDLLELPWLYLGPYIAFK